ncbi:MAG: hypothetical protein CL878_02485 [Dehalococcoidia bacterium]|nr:hypothetical protein [Dehalococcoidia bacterium]
MRPAPGVVLVCPAWHYADDLGVPLALAAEGKDAQTMQYRKMGNSDLEVSAIGFGCWEMGGGYGAFAAQEVIAAIHRALELGVTLFDTARSYGRGASEELLAQGLGARRKDAVVVTKGGLATREGQLDSKPRLPGTRPSGRDSRYDSLIADCEDCLRSLDTDYVDLFLIHHPDVATPFEEGMRALNDLLAAGKTRYIGVSNYESAQLRRSRAVAPLITNQVGFNLFDRRWEYEMFPTAKELDVGIMAYGPLSHGLLTGTFAVGMSFEEDDWRRAGNMKGQQLFTPENAAHNLAVVDQLQGVAQRLGITLPQLAIAWVLSNEQVDVALCGTRRPAEIEDSVEAVNVTLSREVLREIEEIMAGAIGLAETLPSSETRVPYPAQSLA